VLQASILQHLLFNAFLRAREIYTYIGSLEEGRAKLVLRVNDVIDDTTVKLISLNFFHRGLYLL